MRVLARPVKGTWLDAELTAQTLPLAGVRVCELLIGSDVRHNAHLLKVTEALSAAGAEVTVVYSCPEDHRFGEVPFETVWVQPMVASEHPVWAIRVVTNLWRQHVGLPWRLRLAALRAKADVYHAHFLDTVDAARFAAVLRRAKVVYDVLDLLVDEGARIWSPWTLRHYTRLERREIRRVDAVLTVSQPMTDILESRFGPLPATVIMNGASQCLEPSLEVGRPVRLFFQGSFGYERNLPALVRAMSTLRGRATLTLQGWGGIEDELHAIVAEQNLDDVVRFMDRCGPEQVVSCARSFDVGMIVHRGDTPNLTIAAPNKLHDYLGAGLAIAASDLPGLRSVLGSSHAAVFIDPSSPETIAASLDELLAHPERIADMKTAAHTLCATLCWDEQARRLVGVYRSILRRGAGAGAR